MNIITYRSVIDGKLKSYDQDELVREASRKSGVRASYFHRINANLRLINDLIPIIRILDKGKSSVDNCSRMCLHIDVC